VKFKLAMKLAVVLLAILVGSTLLRAQSNNPKTTTPVDDKQTDYPEDEVGLLVFDSSWIPIDAVTPSKTRAKHGAIAALSYGMVPANIVSEYPGAHASVQIKSRRVRLCVCNLLSLPGEPAIVKLRPKKNSRELDGGRLPVFGAKASEAIQSDLIPVELKHPERTIWLVESVDVLPAGEYALMLGIQNVSVFPFTVLNKAIGSAFPTQVQQQTVPSKR
jgi:hypothetical protein